MRTSAKAPKGNDRSRTHLPSARLGRIQGSEHGARRESPAPLPCHRLPDEPHGSRSSLRRSPNLASSSSSLLYLGSRPGFTSSPETSVPIDLSGHPLGGFPARDQCPDPGLGSDVAGERHQKGANKGGNK